MAEKHIVRHWRGKRESYNFLKEVNHLDPWTRYSVIDSASTGTGITEYFGENQIAVETGQILPVSAIVATAIPFYRARPYDRYLVGNDNDGYKIVEYQPRSTADGVVLTPYEMPFDWRYGVRVRADGLKNYVYADGHLVTYDDVDCGIF